MHQLILCADDYGLAPGVNRGIIQLLERGRISATGVMTGSPFWPEAAGALRELKGRGEFGIHLTLTTLYPLGPMPGFAPSGVLPPLKEVILRAFSGRIKLEEIKAEFNRQFDCFVQHFGSLPDFLDGHHHVHQLPIVRDAVLDIFEQRMQGKGYIRSCSEPIREIWKRGIDPVRAMIISKIGSGFQAVVKERKIPTNKSFRGVYDFSGAIPYAEIFPRFLAPAQDGVLIMCHPGYADAELAALDSLTTQREVELNYFLGDEFPHALIRAGYVLGKAPA